MAKTLLYVLEVYWIIGILQGSPEVEGKQQNKARITVCERVCVCQQIT